MATIATYILSGLLLFVLYKFLKPQKQSLPLPPSPPTDPILGHIRSIPSKNPELTYMKWGKQYNTDILYLSFLTQPVLILNTAADAIALLDKRGALFSDRSDFHFFKEQGWTNSLTFFSRSAEFKKHRKIFGSSFTLAKCVGYQAGQVEEAWKMVRRILESPGEWNGEVKAYTTAVVLRIAYGIEVKGRDDLYVKIADQISEAGGTGGSTGIRRLPEWVTFIPSLKFARDHREYVRKMHNLPFEHVKKEIAQGGSTPSFIRSLIEERDVLGETPDEITDADIEGAGATLYTAAQDTTHSTITVFILAMLLNPSIQSTAQAEIDRVVPADRFPDFTHREKLPYIERLVQEVFRWNPVVPLSTTSSPSQIHVKVLMSKAIPHKSSKATTYKGYYIPAGTLVIANAYAIHRDPNVYKDPDRFWPDRYLPPSEGGDGAPVPCAHFGFGRRICPGQNLGYAGVWIAVVGILATMRVRKVRDERGKEVEPNVGMTTGLTR
ncbi:Cytochrome P450 [Glarea lozoyensis ATCC 20868]|uniref:Cytochrome P450 n=1 Tax=Glarea lozoyensis (strain ATCC 20868 / MF5171) TaxID=1116229 RepID=S3DYI2_GLAL2|nr:Cytochrome P450 [Glarea lozoyensis ATCC 20868]EPE37001.1 Cytochrome P450 [Glarea lozoyensis ATCC 20868]